MHLCNSNLPCSRANYYVKRSPSDLDENSYWDITIWMLSVMVILNVSVYQDHLQGLLNQAPAGISSKTGPRRGLRNCIWNKSPPISPPRPSMWGWLLLLLVWALHFEDPDLQELQSQTGEAAGQVRHTAVINSI